MRVKVWGVITYLHSFKWALHKIHINHKKKASKVTLEQPGRSHFIQMIRVITSNGTNTNMRFCYGALWKPHIIPATFLPKTYNLDYEETSGKFKMKNNIIGLYTLECNVICGHTYTLTNTHTQKIKEMFQINENLKKYNNQMKCLILDFLLDRWYYLDHWKNLNKNLIIVFMLWSRSVVFDSLRSHGL